MVNIGGQYRWSIQEVNVCGFHLAEQNFKIEHTMLDV